MEYLYCFCRSCIHLTSKLQRLFDIFLNFYRFLLCYTCFKKHFGVGIKLQLNNCSNSEIANIIACTVPDKTHALGTVHIFTPRTVTIFAVLLFTPRSDSTFAVLWTTPKIVTPKLKFFSLQKFFQSKNFTYWKMSLAPTPKTLPKKKHIVMW